MLDNQEIKEPLVSIIIPSYNHETYVEDAIRSVWTQTYKNIELIVVDDGSKDNSVNVIKGLESQSPIKMITVFNENQGLCKTLNQGLSLASGEYISYLASDDRFLPNKLKTLVPVISKDESIGMVYSDGYLINMSGVQIGKISKKSTYKSGNIYEDLLLCRYIIQYSTTLYSSKVIREVGGFNEKYAFEDWDIFLKVTRNYQCIFVDSEVSEYRVGNNASLSHQLDKLLPDVLEIFENNLTAYQQEKYYLWRFYAKSMMYHRIGESFYVVNNFSTARFWLFKSILNNPIQIHAYDLFARSLLGVSVVNKLRKIRNKSI